MTYEINLSEKLYAFVANWYIDWHGPHVDPIFVISACAKAHKITYYDRDKAVEVYTARIRDMFDRIGTSLSYDACRLYVPDRIPQNSVYMIRDRAMGIHVPSIVKDYEDDGYVITPTGYVYTPDMWEGLKEQMAPIGTIDIYSHFTKLPGGTRQQIADRYAGLYRQTHDDVWEPYKVSPQS